MLPHPDEGKGDGNKKMRKPVKMRNDVSKSLKISQLPTLVEEVDVGSCNAADHPLSGGRGSQPGAVGKVGSKNK
jgi:hypothetical protein